MRTDQQMLDLILGTARQDQRIRAVMMNGSRANPNAARDPFQDFDIVYFVTEAAPFTRNWEWIARFGEMMILQTPDDMLDPPPDPDNVGYGYLMQFIDGTRIDLSIFPVTHLERWEKDSQTIILLDKDGLFTDVPPPSDHDSLPKPPSQKAFDDCCNEFWWVSPYVAKGLWRGELTYAKGFLDEYTRPQLMKMLFWRVGVVTGFTGNPGKLGKYLSRFLDPATMRRLWDTYAGIEEADNWRALYAMGELFRDSARLVAAHFGYTYPEGDDVRVSSYLRRIQALPRDATEITP